ncbi:MAG: hypothetical protein GX085_00885 [Firmicutes bacterium]|nr:hypothetical protein [Bacillota bacterium]
MRPFIFILSFVMLLFPFTTGEIKNKAIGLGDHLVSCVIENREISSKYAVHIGESLQLALQEKKEEFIEGYEIEFRKRDMEFPYGDGKARYRIIIYSSKKEKLLTLRLKYDKKEAKFHILGFASATNGRKNHTLTKQLRISPIYMRWWSLLP